MADWDGTLGRGITFRRGPARAAACVVSLALWATVRATRGEVALRISSIIGGAPFAQSTAEADTVTKEYALCQMRSPVAAEMLLSLPQQRHGTACELRGLETRRPNWHCGRLWIVLGSPTPQTNLRFQISVGGLTLFFRLSGWRSSLMGAFGTDARSMGHGPSRTRSSGVKRSRQTAVATPRQTAICGQPTGASFECGSTKTLTKQQPGSRRLPGNPHRKLESCTIRSHHQRCFQRCERAPRRCDPQASPRRVSAAQACRADHVGQEAVQRVIQQDGRACSAIAPS
jgi:hypothetical protein